MVFVAAAVILHVVAVALFALLLYALQVLLLRLLAIDQMQKKPQYFAIIEDSTLKS